MAMSRSRSWSRVAGGGGGGVSSADGDGDEGEDEEAVDAEVARDVVQLRASVLESRRARFTHGQTEPARLLVEGLGHRDL